MLKTCDKNKTDSWRLTHCFARFPVVPGWQQGSAEEPGNWRHHGVHEGLPRGLGARQVLLHRLRGRDHNQHVALDHRLGAAACLWVSDKMKIIIIKTYFYSFPAAGRNFVKPPRAYDGILQCCGAELWPREEWLWWLLRWLRELWQIRLPRQSQGSRQEPRPGEEQGQGFQEEEESEAPQGTVQGAGKAHEQFFFGSGLELYSRLSTMFSNVLSFSRRRTRTTATATAGRTMTTSGTSRTRGTARPRNCPSPWLTLTWCPPGQRVWRRGSSWSTEPQSQLEIEINFWYTRQNDNTLVTGQSWRDLTVTMKNLRIM